MNTFLQGLAWVVGVIAFLILAGWVGHKSGRKLARKYPSTAMALWMLGNFIKIDPPPPPKIQRVIKDEGAAGDPPKV